MNRLARSETNHKRAWDYLRDELHADIALVQEARPPAEFKSKVYRPVDKKQYNWGSAVVALQPGLTLQPRPRVPLKKSLPDAVAINELPDSHPDACAVGDVVVRGHRLFTAVSLYGSWEMMPGGKSMYACARLHRMVSDLTGVLAKSRRHPVVLAGDLNVTTQYVKTEAEADGAAAFFARLRAWRLVDCIARTRTSRPSLAACACVDGEACSHVQTFRSRAASDLRQLDYAFVSESIVSTLSKCRVIHDAAAWQLSDHCPILLDLNVEESK